MTVNIFYCLNFIQRENMMFGGPAQSISGKLFDMLSNEDVTPEELFMVKSINGDIRQNIQKFLAFCARKREFTVRMINLCFNSQYSQLQEENKQKVAQYTIESLSNDEDALAQFLFNGPNLLKNSSQVSEKIDDDDETENIESQAQRLFGDDFPKAQSYSWEKQPQVFEKYELVKLTLQHLKEKNKNQTCLGYIHKVYSSILRRQGKCFLEFLEANNQYLGLFFENLEYPSISNIVALILASEDKSGQYAHEPLKIQIFKKLLNYAFQNISEQSKFQGFMATVEQIFHSTKQSYYEYFEDFKRCANILVSEQTLQKFYGYLNNGEEKQFKNSIAYLELVIKRINSQTEDQDYYKQQENSEPSMKFEHQFLFKEQKNLLNLFEKSSKYSSITRITYLYFLINVLKNQKTTDGDLDNLTIFKELCIFHFKETNKGLIKNYIYQLLNIILKRSSAEQVDSISQYVLSQKFSDDYIDENKRSSLTEINSDPTSCYILALLLQVEDKKKGFIKQSHLKSQDLLQKTHQKYHTKLADYGQQTPFFDLDLFIPKKADSDIVKSNQKKVESPNQKEQIHIGKNNILIPSLNLPNKADNIKVFIEEEPVQQVELPKQPTRQSIIQDLKNTVIQIPDKLKKKQGNKIQPKNQQKVETSEDIKPEITSKSQVNPEIKQKRSIFYIRHLILF